MKPTKHAVSCTESASKGLDLHAIGNNRVTQQHIWCNFQQEMEAFGAASLHAFHVKVGRVSLRCR